MMTHLSRRNLLKTGLAVSAGLVGAESVPFLTAAEASVPAGQLAPSASTPDVFFEESASPRERLLLDFGWRFHLGNADDAAKDFRFGAPVREGTFAKAGQDWLHNPADPPLQHSFDDSAWRVIDLPHDWALELPYVPAQEPDMKAHAAHGGKPLGREYPATSIGWYDRTFDVPAEDAGLRHTLEFDGVFRDSTVFINGFYLGRNLSGYAPFSFDVTDYIKYGGKNVVTVRVDATLNEGWYYEGAGIYRHTWLTKTHPLHIAQWGTCVRSQIRHADAVVSIETEILNESDKGAAGRVISRVLGPDGALVATVPAKPFEISAWESQTVKTQVSVLQPQLWSIEEPRLYRVVTRIESDGKTVDDGGTTFGIRSIRFDADRGFFLNEKPVKIKGTCNHQDYAGVGIAVPDRMHGDRVVSLKAMGSNAWRTAHNPVAPELLDACDRLGMLVMCETRMMASTPEGLSQLERMIRRDRNHPSVIIWSLANEEYFYQGTPTGARIVSSMKRLAKKLDPTRPVTAAMNGSWIRGGVSDVVDVQGFNYLNGGRPEDKSEHAAPSADIDKFHLEFPNLPTIGTEQANGQSARGIYRTDPERGYNGLFDGKSSGRPLAIETWWKMFDERPFVSGGFTWSGFDYRGEPSYDRVSVSSQCGIFDLCGFRKDIFYYYHSWWGSEPVLHVFPHWNWNGSEGKDVAVFCFSNLDSVELFINGKSAGSQIVPHDSHLTWTVPYAPGAIEVRGTKNGRVVLTDRRETTGAAAKLVLRPGRSRIAADGEDVIGIAVEVQDSAGRIVPNACNPVKFQLAGAGKILGVGNGDSSSHEPDRPAAPNAAVRNVFNGLCLAIVQAGKEAGTIQVEASAEGLQSAKVEIQAEPTKLRPAVA
jgi:beta-galactosidase